MSDSIDQKTIEQLKRAFIKKMCVRHTEYLRAEIIDALDKSDLVNFEATTTSPGAMEKTIRVAGAELQFNINLPPAKRALLDRAALKSANAELEELEEEANKTFFQSDEWAGPRERFIDGAIDGVKYYIQEKLGPRLEEVIFNGINETTLSNAVITITKTSVAAATTKPVEKTDAT